MPDLLLELFSEEIPARMQRRAAEDLRKLVTDALVEAGLVYEGAKSFATPRRLALTVHGLPARSPDRREEKKGPRVGAPQQAIAGFLKAAGLASIDQAQVQPDKKGDFYVAVSARPGRVAAEVIAEIVPRIVRAFPWPRSMRWGEASARSGSFAWVRPLHSILCTFGPETEEPEVVAFEIDGIRSGRETRGHRFMAPAAFPVKRFDDYAGKLEKAKVILDADRRKDIILTDARNQALALGLELVEDEGLLEEVAGLVEWPVVLVGSFDEAFLEIPPEVIRATIRANQKCFVLRKPGASFEARPAGRAPQDEDGGSSGAQDEGWASGDGWGSGGGVDASRGNGGVPDQSRESSAEDRGRGNGGADASVAARNPPHPEVGAERASKDAPGTNLSNRFVLVANIEASDGGKAIAAGNGRVIRARLSDARHFWQTDLRPLPDITPEMQAAAGRLHLDLARPLDQRMAKLAATNVVFHEKLGTQGERVQRIARLAREIAPLVGADPEKAGRAAELAKADLVTEMVGEFPELQGLMGRYYASAQGEDPSVAAAIEDHYKPVGPSDRVPTDPVAIAVALADKLDTLVGFWAIDEKPTGSKDPYALRRAALGVIRIALENRLRIPLSKVLWRAAVWKRASDYLRATYQFDQEFQISVAWAGIQRPWERAQPGLLPDDNVKAWLADLDAQISVWRTIVAWDDDETGQEARLAPSETPDGEVHPFHGIPDLLAFLADRLKVQLREQGARHDLVDAVFAVGRNSAHDEAIRQGAASPLPGGERDRVRGLQTSPDGSGVLSPGSPKLADARQGEPASPHRGEAAGARGRDLPAGTVAGPANRDPAAGEAAGATGRDLRVGEAVQDDLLLIVRRVEALGKFLDSEDGRNLLTGYRRAVNILRDEEKKSGQSFAGEVDRALLVEPEEQALAAAIDAAIPAATGAVEAEDFAAAMMALAGLRAPVDAFFEKVLVNAPDGTLRANRLRLLNRIRAATLAVADFSKVGG